MMLTLKLGPLVVPMSLVTIIFPVLVAHSVSYLIARRQKSASVGDVLSNMLIVGLLAARLTFVGTWSDLYLAAPWSIIDIRDGGFTPWAGLPAAALVAIWHGWRQPLMRKPLTLALSAAALSAMALSASLYIMQDKSAPLPATTLTTLVGNPINLSALSEGKPMVVNLWASWCPPCHREMPVLAAAQNQQADVQVVLVNQGEDAATVQRYLQSSELDLRHVVLDQGTDVGKAVGSMMLPTTLFYDRKGRLIETHLGELSAASLASKLERIGASKPIHPSITN